MPGGAPGTHGDRVPSASADPTQGVLVNERPRLLVIQHNLDDGLNELGAPLAEAGLYIDVWDTRLRPEPAADVAVYDGIVTLGGLDSAAHEAGRPEVTAERELLAHALATGTPVLGLCFGAQLLARAAGGSVLPADRKEIGWCPVDLEPAARSDELLGHLPAKVRVFQYHYDTFTLPSSAQVLARNGDLIQAFRVGDVAWGMQFHLEVNPGQVYGWLGTYGDEMQAAGVDLDELRTVTAAYAPVYREMTWTVGGAFARKVAEHRERRSA